MGAMENQRLEIVGLLKSRVCRRKTVESGCKVEYGGCR